MNLRRLVPNQEQHCENEGFIVKMVVLATRMIDHLAEMLRYVVASLRATEQPSRAPIYTAQAFRPDFRALMLRPSTAQRHSNTVHVHRATA